MPFFPAPACPCREILQATHARGPFTQSFFGRRPPPAEPLFGLPDIAGAQSERNFRNEQPSLVPRQRLGCHDDQTVTPIGSAFHGYSPGFKGPKPPVSHLVAIQKRPILGKLP